MNFTDSQLKRYSRNIFLQEVGIKGQEKLFQAKVLIVGAGGLGSPAALYLAAAGIGTVGIADYDAVELSNLQRQIIHFTKDITSPKVHSAADKMRAINPDIVVNKHWVSICADNIRDIIREYDFIIDGSDNFPTKFLINDACIIENIPFSHGGVLRFEGQTMTVLPGKSACYRCAFPKPPPVNAVPTCSQVGILGAIAGILGTIQAAEALKYVLEVGELLTDALLSFDAKIMDFHKIRLKKQKSCQICGENPTITELHDEE
ncbi:ThiF family adenylyltransferase [Thermodesulfobacteriota bacterium]